MLEKSTIIPYLFGDNLVIGLSKKWIDRFEKIPEFTVSIDKQNRLQIISKDTIK